MAESTAFSFVTEALERETSLDRLESRGTVRLALKQAGLDASSVTADQMQVVLRKILPAELESRSIADAAATCESVAGRLSGLGPDAGGADTPEAVFARLGGS